MTTRSQTGSRIETKRLTIHARLEGQGPPLLFLGGSNFDLTLRAPVFDSELADHFTIAAADPRGLGHTDAPPGPWSMDDYAEDAIALLDALGWPSANLVGESFGAMTALHIAKHHPDRIRRMALVAGAPGGEGGRSYPIHEFLEIPDPKERVSAALRIQDLTFPILERNDPQAAEVVIEARLQRDRRFLDHRNNREGYPRLLAARALHDCWDALPTITIPTLIIAGERDGQAPIASSRAMAKRMPVAQLLSFDAGHGLLFATPEPVQAILSFWGQTSSTDHLSSALA